MVVINFVKLKLDGLVQGHQILAVASLFVEMDLMCKERFVMMVIMILYQSVKEIVLVLLVDGHVL